METTRTTIRTVEELTRFLEDDFNHHVIALDTETGPYGSEDALRYDRQSCLCITLTDGAHSAYILPSKEIVEILREVLSESTIAFHNAIFDMKVLYKLGWHTEENELFDTMVADHLVDENRSHKLKDLAQNILGKDVTKWTDLKAAPHTPAFIEYAINDAEWTFELMWALKAQMEAEGTDVLFREVEMPFLKVLFSMEINGILVDKSKIELTTQQLREAQMNSEARLYEILNEKYSVQYDLVSGTPRIVGNRNFNSTQQLARIFEKLGIEVTERTATGAPSIGKRTINACKGQHEFIAELERYKIIQKLLTAFFEPLPDYIDGDGRVRPSFRDTGTVTGRLSCSKPNIQQLPKVNKAFPIETRGVFVAPPGKKLVAVDYSQQELRIAAHLSNDITIISIIMNHGDLHLINANKVFNLGIEEEKCYANHPEHEETKSKYKKERDKGKIFSFGILYGMGKHKLSKDFNVSLEEAEVLLQNYFAGYPELKRAIDSCHEQATKDLFVTTLHGRRRHFTRNQWGKLDDSALRQSFNFLIQSAGADYIRMACINLYEYSKRHPEMDIKLLMTVHDEVVFEVNQQYADQACSDAEKLLEACGNLCVPLKAEGGVGDSYATAK